MTFVPDLAQRRLCQDTSALYPSDPCESTGFLDFFWPANPSLHRRQSRGRPKWNGPRAVLGSQRLRMHRHGGINLSVRSCWRRLRVLCKCPKCRAVAQRRLSGRGGACSFAAASHSSVADATRPSSLNLYPWAEAARLPPAHRYAMAGTTIAESCRHGALTSVGLEYPCT